MADTRLDQLVELFQQRHSDGQPVTAEGLCYDCPELLEPLLQRLIELGYSPAPTSKPPDPSQTDTGKDKKKGKDQSPAPPASAPIPDVAQVPLIAGAEPLPGYRLVKLLGRGGFGEVWKATGPEGIEVAVKFLTLSSQAEVEAHRQEMFSGMTHAQLPKQYGCWRSPEHLIIVMELAESSLYDRWRECHEQGFPGIPWDELIGYMREAAEGIDHLNNQGIQHRDIKPQNLLLMHGHVKLADFGLAKAMQGAVVSHTGTMSPAYAATEFFEGKTSQYSDQYSLAVSYCHLRGGRVPYEGTIARITFGHLTRPPDLSMLPEEEKPVVAKALAKIPEQRWPSCRDFVTALEACSGPATRIAAPSPPAAEAEEPLQPAEPPSSQSGARLLAKSAPPPSSGAIRALTDTSQKPVSKSRIAALEVDVFATAPIEVRAATKSQSSSQIGRLMANSIGINFAIIPPGEFLMGSPDHEADAGRDERPQHRVRITKPFCLGVHAVTQAQFERVMGFNPSKFHPGEGGGPTHPVEKVTWDAAVEFCLRLSALPDEKKAGRIYRLPTEAEWEYACRAGSPAPCCFGTSLSSSQANFNGKFPYGGAPTGPVRGRTTPVGSFKPNGFGLYDMHGNVWEWCADHYDPKYYRDSPVDDPTGPSDGNQRVVRGGSWFDYGYHCRAAERSPIPPDAGYKNIGFRVAMTIAKAAGK